MLVPRRPSGPFQGARNLSVGGTGELYRARGTDCNEAGLAGVPDAQLVQVDQQVGWVVVHPIRPRLLELFLSVAA